MTKLSAVKSDNLRITRPLMLREFSADLDGDYLSVWLNVDADFLREWYNLQEMNDENIKAVDALNVELQEKVTDERANEIARLVDASKDAFWVANFELMAKFWGCTVEDCASIKEASEPLYNWCVTRSFEMLSEYNSRAKKA